MSQAIINNNYANVLVGFIKSLCQSKRENELKMKIQQLEREIHEMRTKQMENRQEQVEKWQEMRWKQMESRQQEREEMQKIRLELEINKNRIILFNGLFCGFLMCFVVFYEQNKNL